MSNKRFYNFLSVSFTLLSCQAAEWTITPTESKASLRAIVALSDREVFASGTGGTLLHTVNGGKHWSKTSGLPDDLDFRGMQTFDGRTIHLMSAGPGDKSRIYRSTDGGRLWTLVHGNELAAGFFDNIAFFNKRQGLVLGDPLDGKFFLLATDDGGATWQRLEGPTANQDEGAFAASNTSLMVTAQGHAWFATGGVLGGRVFHSTDFGRTWTSAQASIPHGTATAGVFGLAFANQRHGFAAGGDYKKPEDAQAVLAETTDGGATWREVPGPAGFRSAVAVKGGHVITTGPGGTDHRAGPKAAWAPVPQEGFHALSVPPRGKLVWASGGNGRVAYLWLR